MSKNKTNVYDPLMSTADAAKYLGYSSARSLINKRHRGEGPEYLKIDNRVYYRTSAVEAWINEHAEKNDGTKQ